MLEEQFDFYRRGKQAIMPGTKDLDTNKKNNSKEQQSDILERYKLGAKQRMLAAVEIYNKPVFYCKQEIYAILAVSAFEFLFKAKLIKEKGPDALESDTTRRKTFDPLLSEMKKMGLISDQVRINLEALRDLRNECCHGSFNTELIEDISRISLACFHNFLTAYKEWFGENLSKKAEFGLSPIFYHLPSKEDHKDIPMDPDIKKVIDDACAYPYNPSDKYHVYVKYKVKIDHDASSKSSLPAKNDPNNPNAISVKPDPKNVQKTHPYYYKDIQKKIKKLNNNKPVSPSLYKKIFDELKLNEKCSNKWYPNPLKDVKPTYTYNIGECIPIIKRHLKLLK